MPASLEISGDSSGFQLLAAADGKLRTFSIVAYTGVAMQLKGFNYPLVVDLKGMSLPSESRPVLFDHDHDRIVGHSTIIENTGNLLNISGVVSGIGDDATRVAAMAANGFPWGASIGAGIQELEFIDRGQSVKANGRIFNGPVYVARKTTLKEVSFVSIGADLATNAKIAATSNTIKGADMDFNAWVASLGFDPSVLTAEQLAALQSIYDRTAITPVAAASGKSAGKPEFETFDNILAKAHENEKRRTRITEIVAQAISDHPDQLDAIEAIGRCSLEGNWDTNRTELEFVRTLRTKAPFVFTKSKPELTGKVIEAAVCQAGRLEGVEKQFDEKTLEAAHQQFRNGLGLCDLVMTFAQRNGYRGLSIGQNLEPALRAAFSRDDREIRAAGPSTYDLSGILSNVANKFLKTGFDFVEQEWRKISAIRNVRDFKTITSYRLDGDLTYSVVAPGGEINHGTLSEGSYTNRVDTYGKMLGIDRRDLINDDLGALTNAGRRLGRGAALKLNDVFWTEFLNNSAFFTTGNLNFDDGADTVFDSTGLGRADVMFRAQTDPDGKPLATMPRILLVPPGHRVPALRLMNSQQVLTASDIGSSNPWAGAFNVVSSVYMSNSTFTGYSALKWYLLADPNDIAVIETAFLNGQEQPTVETADMDFSRLGISLRGFHDFGVNLQEYRGGVAFKGEA